jgi:putative redox protein
MKIHVTQISQHHFRFEIRGMHGELDVPNQPEQKPAGPTPKELLLAALCGCTGTDVVDLLAKFQVKYDELTLEARATVTERHPKVFDEIRLVYQLQGSQIDTEKVGEAVRRSLRQYSGTAAMLSRTAPIYYLVHINDEITARGKADFAPVEKSVP